jgi:TolB-like protein
MTRILTTALIVVFAGALATAQPQERVTIERPAERLLVLPFEQLDPDPQHAWIAQAVHRTLLVDLAELPTLVPVTLPADQAVGLDRQDRLALDETAASAGARLILSGTYQIADEQIRMTATLLDITREEPVAAMRTTADLADLFELQDALGEHVRLLLHEFDPALVQDHRLPLPAYPPAVDQRPPPAPYAPISEPYYEPPSYVFVPTYIPTYYPYYYPPKVYCPIWHSTPPFHTTTFFHFTVTSKPKTRIPHRGWHADVRSGAPRPAAADRPSHEQHGIRSGGSDQRPLMGPQPARTEASTPRLTDRPPAVIVDSPYPPSDSRDSDRRQASRPANPSERPPRLAPPPDRTITIAPPPEPEAPAIQPPLQPLPERSVTIRPRLGPDSSAAIVDSPRPPNDDLRRDDWRTNRPARGVEAQPRTAPEPPRTITIPPRTAPEAPPRLAQPVPAPQPERAAPVRRLRPDQPTTIVDSPQPMTQSRIAPQRQTVPPAVTTPPARPAGEPPRLAPRPSPVIADSPRPPAQPAAEPQASPEQPARGPAGRRR